MQRAIFTFELPARFGDNQIEIVNLTCVVRLICLTEHVQLAPGGQQIKQRYRIRKVERHFVTASDLGHDKAPSELETLYFVSVSLSLHRQRIASIIIISTQKKNVRFFFHFSPAREKKS